MSKLLVLISAIGLALCSACDAGPGARVGSHEKEIATLTKWMRDQGLTLRASEAAMIGKSDPQLLSYDYQWYEGSYRRSPVFFVFVYFDDKGEVRVMTFNQGGEGYEKAASAAKELAVEIKKLFQKKC